MDTDQFCAPPLTTGALKAYFLAHGRSAAGTNVDLVHFPHADAVLTWLDTAWAETVRPAAEAALAVGVQPVLALSCYTWNMAEFLTVSRRTKREVPG
jgi:hypothetical protein